MQYFTFQDRAALSASLRALGIFIMFPCYLTDTTFHMDVTEALLPNLPLVKVRWCWSVDQYCMLFVIR